jgi:hypothetical protein
MAHEKYYRDPAHIQADDKARRELLGLLRRKQITGDQVLEELRRRYAENLKLFDPTNHRRVEKARAKV